MRLNNIKILSLTLLFLVIFMIQYSYAMKITKYENIQNNVSIYNAKIDFQSGLNESIGINDNGSALINNQIVNYYYTTNSLMGYFAFYGGNFYSGPPVNNNAFSVQLNSNFNVTNSMTLWAQDVFVVESQNGLYYVYVLDNLWNSSYPSFSINQSLVSGYGNFSTSNNQVYYYSFALTNNNVLYYTTLSPFYLYTKMVLSQNSIGYPQIYMYYEFQNKTYNSGWILYDIITIRVKSNNPKFLIGIHNSINSNIPYYPFVTQWVVGGEGGGAQLSVYSWNASMMLYYEYNGRFYSVPDGVSLQPSVFTAFATAENVNQYNGITEYYNYNNSLGLVYQVHGYNKQEFLWQPNSLYILNGHLLKLYLIPPKGEWKIIISGNNGYYNETFGNYSPINYFLPSGQYNLTAILYAGPNPIISFSKTFNITGGIVNVSSPVPFYINGTSENSGRYEFSIKANITFPLIYYENSSSRMIFEYLVVNNKIIKNNSLILYANTNVTAFYKQQYYLTVNIQIPAQINGINTTLKSNWYNESTTINIFKYYYFNNTVRELINSNVTKLQLLNPVNIYASLMYQYFVLINLPNGSISNWYNASSIIKLPIIIYNGLTRYKLNQTSEIIINKPINITPSYIKQYYVKITLPNGTINQWYNANSTIILPKIIINGSTRYIINQTSILYASEPLNITPNYVKQYLIYIVLPNSTINNWYNSNSIISIPKIIYNGSERYVINQTSSIIVDKAINETISYIKQYLVRINFPNGTITAWFNNNTSIKLPKFVYISNNERYILNQSNNIIVLSPLNITPYYVKQFLATINGVSNWYNSGSIIRLYEHVPIYETITWVGNYTLPNNSNLTVNGPIIENAEISTNISFVGTTGVIVIVIVVAIIFISRRH